MKRAIITIVVLLAVMSEAGLARLFTNSVQGTEISAVKENESLEEVEVKILHSNHRTIVKKRLPNVNKVIYTTFSTTRLYDSADPVLKNRRVIAFCSLLI
jgi:predicted nucleic acid-binding protein